MTERTVSVVINTDNRAESLRLTLSSLTQLDYPSFEVVVVRGPTPDATGGVLREYAGRLKVGRCPDRNLSESRNIGIAMAAGDIVAFIDDDAYPDPAWLDQLVEGYDTPEIAAVGGPVWNWTGSELQARYCMANRFGDAWPVVDPSLSTPWLHNFPHTWEFPYTIGTNASFLRPLLIELGGFDEEFEYYLEETDLCSRLIDAGWMVKNLDDGFVYHKFLSSDIRSDNRAIRSYFSVLKNKCYFAFKHALPMTSHYAVWKNLVDFAGLRRADVQGHIAGEHLTAGDLAQFDKDKEAAYDLGFERWQRHEVRTRPVEWFCQLAQPFVAFPTRRRRADKLNVCFFSQEYPPDPLNGIGRVVHQLATGLAGQGHVVHVLTGGTSHHRVDLEEGVWVHRVAVHPCLPPPGDVPRVPARLWDYSASLLDELRRLHARRPVDVVHVPNWDSEGIAVLLDGHFNTVVELHTPLATMAALDPPMRRALAEGDADLAAMVGLERWVYEHAAHLLASGPAIVEEVESAYAIRLDRQRCGFVPHGLHDEAAQMVEPLAGPGRVNVLFVGRLEARKGIDTLLAAIPALARQFGDVAFTVVGEDTRPSEDDLTYRQRFEGSPTWPAVADRVRFYGRVSDAELRRHYAGCDIFVAPSRFESFGLVLLEAMMFAKPIVACDIGGMRYMVEDGRNGFLVPPGDSDALAEAIAKLVSSDQLRVDLGDRSRRRYEERYTVGAMVAATNRYYDELLGRHTADAGSPGGRMSWSVGSASPNSMPTTSRDQVMDPCSQEIMISPGGSSVLPDLVALPTVVNPVLLNQLVYHREWFHQIDLGYGIVTPGIDDSQSKLKWLSLPGSLAGKTVLDVGSYDGFFAYEAERRGAAYVVAADQFCWTRTGMCDGRGFDIAHWALRSRVEKRVVSVEELSPDSVGTFDYVLFLGVLYHSPDPLRYLRNIYSVCRETVFIETHCDGNDYDRPMMVFYPGDTLAGDPSNFWGPNRQCVVAMLWEVGFSRVEVVGEHGSRLVVHAHR